MGSVSSCGYYCGFPIWFVFPQSLSQATQTLGISSILVLFYIFLRILNSELNLL